MPFQQTDRRRGPGRAVMSILEWTVFQKAGSAQFTARPSKRKIRTRGKQEGSLRDRARMQWRGGGRGFRSMEATCSLFKRDPFCVVQRHVSDMRVLSMTAG